MLLKRITVWLVTLSMLFTLISCASKGPNDTNPFRNEPEKLPAEHRPPPTSGGA